MPPRIQAGLIEQFAASSSRPSSTLCSRCLQHRAQSLQPRSRAFSTTPMHAAGSRERSRMMRWMEGAGQRYTDPRPDNYISDGGDMIEEMNTSIEDLVRTVKDYEAKQAHDSTADGKAGEDINEADGGVSLEGDFTDAGRPFPRNPYFISQPVLSDWHKASIWRMIKEEGQSIRQVSVKLGVNMNRVGAVIRLMGVEEQWKKENKPLANAYGRAMMRLLPVTPEEEPHESINDLNTHRATKEQMFYPTSESRTFTRRDAGQIFEKGLLPADARLPHPQLVQMHRDRASIGKPGSNIADEEAVQARLTKFYTNETRRRQSIADRRRSQQARNTMNVEGERATFRITDVTVDEDTVGRDGRGRKGVGARYGVPAQDRKMGQVKIPTSVGVDI